MTRTTICALAVITGLSMGVAAAQQEGLAATESRTLFDEDQVEHLAALSSAGFEAKPDIAADLTTLFFASSQAPSIGSLDLFVATRPAQGQPFGPASAVAELNTVERDHTPTTNSDVTYMVYSSSRTDMGLGTDDAYETSRPDVNSPWGAPVNITQINSPERDMGFTMTPDALTLYFSSNRGKPLGELDTDFDIYVCTRASTADPWGAPVAVAELNTIPFADKFPSVSGDNLVMYFASDRPGSVPDDLLNPSQDTWVAMRPDASSPWTIIENVYETNTKFNEYLMSIADDQSELFFVSDRDGGLGGFDLYRAPAIPGVLRFGAGTDGIFGTPRLRPTGGDPVPGNASFGMEITQIPPGETGFLFVSLAPGPGPILVDLFKSTFVRFNIASGSGSDGGSDITVLTPIPADPALIGVIPYVQAFILDPDGEGLFGGSIVFSATPGNEIEIQEP
jgi:hypothetical protein